MFDEMNEVSEAMNGIIVAMTEDENLFPNMAKMMKRYYDELIEVGFSPDQAVSIIANHKIAG